MKKIAFFLIIGLLATTACDDDLNILPEQSISSDLAFSDIKTAQGVLIGTYDLLQDLHVFGSQPQFISDFVADNVNFTGSLPSLQEFNNFQQISNNTTVSEVWRDSYEAILAANAIIANAQSIPDGTDDEKNQLEGEARFIRALVYFQLANLYAQPWQVSNGSNLAVPLYLDEFTGEVILLPRNTLAEVHDQVIADLNQAQSLLPAVMPQGFASSGAARALLSRLRLYRGEWTQAAELASAVLESGVYSFAPDYSFYSSISPEHVFSIENSAVDPASDTDAELGSGSWDGYYEGSDQSGRGDGGFSADLVAAFEAEPGDLRYALREVANTFGGVAAEFTTKYDDGPNNSSDGPLLRITEVMLNLAEALAELNGKNDATSISLMNQIRERAGLSPWAEDGSSFGTNEAYLEAIATERRKELCFEGHRRMDLLRRGFALRTETSIPATPLANAGVGVGAGDDLAIWPLPTTELDINPQLVQNPGY